MKKYFATFVMMFAIMPAFAINLVGDTARGWWNIGTGNVTGGPEEFIIDGCIGKNCSHGTYGDEWGAVAMIAVQIVEHGGYFCPYQVQCANKRKKKRTWTVYYRPSGYSKDKCAWLCEPGYSGTNCAPAENIPLACDEKPQKKTSGGRFSGLSLKTWGGDSEGVESEVWGFSQWGSDPECDTLLGIVKYLEHGVIAGAVNVCCGRDNWKGIDSFIGSIGTTQVSQKLLCAEGYTANAGANDCVPVDADFCAVQNMSFCQNFDRGGYDKTIHYLDSSSGCVKYLCSETGTAFPAVGDTTCAPCGTGAKGGPSPKNGVCVVCQTGQIFDSESGTCVSAAAYSKSDLQYGKAQTKNSISVSKQCWTLTTPEEYTVCVTSGGARTPADASSSGATVRAARQPIRR